MVHTILLSCHLVIFLMDADTHCIRIPCYLVKCIVSIGSWFTSHWFTSHTHYRAGIGFACMTSSLVSSDHTLLYPY